ncbi:hypothetical protein PAPYR_11638 [Paratrimastix pyriformis]|uniref:Uncharacterized protein n=1 Tax=Paratrimastix pyriformis TaxID=342808 RepID=A0ABQ8U647_9EUKA|nr:hypothetical protein PAPYR_11638 [Paratrimastix pyriformis]
MMNQPPSTTTQPNNNTPELALCFTLKEYIRMRHKEIFPKSSVFNSERSQPHPSELLHHRANPRDSPHALTEWGPVVSYRDQDIEFACGFEGLFNLDERKTVPFRQHCFVAF